jgi:hypothetical protein
MGIPPGPQRPAEGTVGPLLDAAFGMFAWGAHLLTIYIAAALACGLGFVKAGSSASLLTALVLATAIAEIVVVLHALRRWHQQRGRPDKRVRLVVTLGCDAIATVAIVWQLLAIAMVPACA